MPRPTPAGAEAGDAGLDGGTTGPVGGTPSDSGAASPPAALAAATETGISASVTYTSSDKHSAKISSEGWNVVELVPLRKICQDRLTDCSGATGEQRRQLLCDR